MNGPKNTMFLSIISHIQAAVIIFLVETTLIIRISTTYMYRIIKLGVLQYGEWVDFSEEK